MYKDLREWLEEVDKIGELRRLNGADWDVEIGAISAMSVDAVLCDNIVGYPPGYRVLANPIDAIPRWLLMQNWSTKARENALCREWKERLQSFKPVKVKWVDRGPILENIQQGDDIDVFKFPVPKIHPGDAGRYIGSCDSVILKDSDTGRVNLGTYRMQVHDKSTLALYMSSSGKDGAMILKKHQEMQKPCPVLVLVGMEPAIYYASNAELTHVPAFSEYEFAGWLKGAPIEVIKGEFTGLPIPAYAEIAIEGESLPGKGG